jgi:hypothetical protein
VYATGEITLKNWSRRALKTAEGQSAREYKWTSGPTRPPSAIRRSRRESIGPIRPLSVSCPLGTLIANPAVSQVGFDPNNMTNETDQTDQIDQPSDSLNNQWRGESVQARFAEQSLWQGMEDCVEGMRRRVWPEAVMDLVALLGKGSVDGRMRRICSLNGRVISWQ